MAQQNSQGHAHRPKLLTGPSRGASFYLHNSMIRDAEGVVALALGGTARMPKLAVSAVSTSPILAPEGFFGSSAAGNWPLTILSIRYSLADTNPPSLSGPHLSTLSTLKRNCRNLGLLKWWDSRGGWTSLGWYFRISARCDQCDGGLKLRELASTMHNTKL